MYRYYKTIQFSKLAMANQELNITQLYTYNYVAYIISYVDTMATVSNFHVIKGAASRQLT